MKAFESGKKRTESVKKGKRIETEINIRLFCYLFIAFYWHYSVRISHSPTIISVSKYEELARRGQNKISHFLSKWAFGNNRKKNDLLLLQWTIQMEQMEMETKRKQEKKNSTPTCSKIAIRRQIFNLQTTNNNVAAFTFFLFKWIDTAVKSTQKGT